jgi:ribonucleotide monophosphatase NagD (HAD superfamily)
VPQLSFDAAWAAYRRAEPRLPPKPPPVAPRRIAGIAEILDEVDLVLLDAWGVLNIGDRVIPSALDAVKALRRAGKRLMILSNSGSHDPAESIARHNRRGFDFRLDEIVTGLDLLPGTLARLALPTPLGLIADPPAPCRAITGAMLPLGDDPADYDRVSGVVFLSSDGWSEARQARLEASLARRPRPLLVGNPDIVSPEPGYMNCEPGYYAHRIAAATVVEPVFLGKPFAPVYERARRRHADVPPERVLCVGDTPHTDVLGGRCAGFRTLLVEDGFCAGRDALALSAECGIWPDFVAPRL